tara:strand:- start:3127 stop:3462 length:336 start_codon:yes stop_codon:yes gene_type:complete
MALDHEAILRAYSGTVVTTCDMTNAAYDASNNKVTLDDAKITAARSEIDKEEAAVKYKKDRVGYPHGTATVYATIGDQLDMIYADLVAGKLDTTGTWATHIKAVKDAHPKP